jgi:selenocysteine lyase/cysteine desulfurase
VLQVDELRRALAPHDDRIMLVVDGAQAVGNISVGREVLSASDFYATSGHKWLLGKSSLGFLVSNPTRLAAAGIDLVKVADASFPFSSPSSATDYAQETSSVRLKVE